MKKTQKEIIRKKLLRDGFITRNWCLQRYISKLGARINDLKKEGLEICGRIVQTKTGTDYIYNIKQK